MHPLVTLPLMIFMLSDNKTFVTFHHNRHHDLNYTFLCAKEELMADRNEVWASLSTDKGLTWSEPRFIFANVCNPKFENAFYNYACSYLDMILDDNNTVHLFVPHLWHQVLHLTMTENELKNAPLKGDIFPL